MDISSVNQLSTRAPNHKFDESLTLNSSTPVLSGAQMTQWFHHRRPAAAYHCSGSLAVDRYVYFQSTQVAVAAAAAVDAYLQQLQTLTAAVRTPQRCADSSSVAKTMSDGCLAQRRRHSGAGNDCRTFNTVNFAQIND